VGVVVVAAAVVDDDLLLGDVDVNVDEIDDVLTVRAYRCRPISSC
jgi:hypothetical protein